MGRWRSRVALSAFVPQQRNRLAPRTLSKDVKPITLSYTFFEVGGKIPPAPTSTVDAAPHVEVPKGS